MKSAGSMPEWIASLARAKQLAAEKTRPLLLCFLTRNPAMNPADGDCELRNPESECFADPAVREFLGEHCLPVCLPVHEHRDLAEAYHVKVTPVLVVCDEQGVVHDRIDGCLVPRDLLGHLALGLGRYWVSKGQWDKARERFEEVVRHHPGSEMAADARTLIQSIRRKLDETVAEASEESFPASDPPAWTLGREPAGLASEGNAGR